MKQLLATLATFLLLVAPAMAENVIVGEFTSVSLSEDTTDAEFEMNGVSVDWYHFNESNDMYFGTSGGSVSGSDRLCDIDFCLDFDVDLTYTEFAIGYSLENRFTPFASIAFSETVLDFGVSGLGIVDVTQDETSLNAGTFYGDSGGRFMISLNNLDGDEQSLRVGGYYTLDFNNIVLGGSFESPTESFLDSYIISAGIGWSF
ncbi:MAG: hypothetical protein F4X44_10115 [Gammaproteobacteria bacterium]|nr:hypothetical protein [Gammaproteobacteria bacterium]MYD80953.1 hypothetical protein [Gammaproteobacteria bacterium]